MRHIKQICFPQEGIFQKSSLRFVWNLDEFLKDIPQYAETKKIILTFNYYIIHCIAAKKCYTLSNYYKIWCNFSF